MHTKSIVEDLFKVLGIYQQERSMYLVDHPIFKIIAERQDTHLVNHVQLPSSETEV